MSDGSIEYDVQTQNELSGSFSLFNARKPPIRERPWAAIQCLRSAGTQPIRSAASGVVGKSCAPIGSLDSIGDTLRQRLVRGVGRFVHSATQSVKVRRTSRSR
jgi:hypothetical protein